MIGKKCFQIMQTMDRLRKTNTWELDYGLSKAENSLLIELCEQYRQNPEVKLSDVTKKISMQPAAVSRILSKLEEHGYLFRENNRKNRREVLIKPTEKGIEHATRQMEAFTSFWNEVFENIPQEDIEEMLRVMNNIIDNMELVYEKRKEK